MTMYFFTFSFLATFVLLAFLFSEKKSRNLKLLVAGVITNQLWLLLDALPFYVQNTEISVYFYILKLPLIFILPSIFYLFTVSYTGYLGGFKSRHLLVLVIPSVLLLSFLTDGFPFKMISDASLIYVAKMPVFSYVAEFGFKLSTLYSYLIVGLITAMFAVKTINTPRSYKLPNLLILVSILVTIMINVIIIYNHVVSKHFGIEFLDITSFLMFITLVFTYFGCYHSTMGHDVMVKQQELDLALKYDEFELYLQPQFSFQGNAFRLVGAEALIRWVKNGEIYSRPDQFIPVAELTGQIVKIGNWIIDEIFEINKVLRAEGVKTKLSFNVSPVQLNNKRFIEHLESVVANNDLEIDLVAEITESHLIDNEEDAIGVLNRIKNLGIKIALDDFGTGYSSLSHLSRIPLDYLKVDKSFIDDIDLDDKNLTSHILSISKTIKLQTVAEGIERIEQARKLSTFGCDLYQGYLFSRPVRVEEFIQVSSVKSF